MAILVTAIVLRGLRLKRIQYRRQSEIEDAVEGEHVDPHGKKHIKAGVLASGATWAPAAQA